MHTSCSLPRWLRFLDAWLRHADCAISLVDLPAFGNIDAPLDCAIWLHHWLRFLDAWLRHADCVISLTSLPEISDINAPFDCAVWLDGRS